MANPHTGDISVDLDGTTYTLALTLNAMVEVEEMFGLSFDEVMNEAVVKGSAKHLRGLIWATFRRHHPELTLVQAGDLVTGTNLGRLSRMLSRVVTASGPDPADVPKKKANPTNAPAVAGTGARSTLPPAVSG